MAQIPLSHIPNTSRETCKRYTINTRFALGTVSKRQMPANASKTDSKACTENKNKIKKKNNKKGKEVRRSFSDTHVKRPLLFLDTDVLS